MVAVGRAAEILTTLNSCSGRYPRYAMEKRFALSLEYAMSPTIEKQENLRPT
jgi:hypothetical protein